MRERGKTEKVTSSLASRSFGHLILWGNQLFQTKFVCRVERKNRKESFLSLSPSIFYYLSIAQFPLFLHSALCMREEILTKGNKMQK